ncbi:MAG: tetratricopeptide repeat protein [Elusimicrobiota bacterium]
MRSTFILAAALLTAAALGAFAEPGATYDDAPGETAAQKPGLSPEGEKKVQEIRERIARGERVDVKQAFSGLMETELRNAWPLIDQLARELSSNGNADLTQARMGMWRQYIDKYNDMPEGHIGLGESSADSEDYEGAVLSFSRAIELGALRPDLFYKRGLAADRIGDYELAHRDAAMTLKMEPDDQKALSLFKLTRDRPSKTYIDLQTGRLLAAAAAVAPQRGGASAAAARIPGDKTAAIPAETDPVMRSTHRTRDAQHYLQLGNAAAAAAAAKNAIELNPRNAQAHNLLATAEERAGDHKAAIKNATRALELQPGSVPALNTRAWSKSGLGHFAAALDDARGILTADPYNAFGHVNKARALGGLGRRSEMMEALSRAAQFDERFTGLRDQALQLTSDADTELLFAGLFGGATSAAAAPPRPGRRKRFLLLIISCMLGGLLVAAGVLHIFAPGRNEAEGRKRSTRRGQR